MEAILTPKKVQRLKPTLENIYDLAACLACAPLLFTVVINNAADAIREIKRTRRFNLKSLTKLFVEPWLIFIFDSLFVFYGIGYGIYAIFHDLLFGRTD